MKKLPNWIIILLVVALLIGSKFLFFAKKDEKSGAPNKPKTQAPVAVNYHVAQLGDYSNNVFAAGKVGAFNQVDLLPEMNGKVVSINFNEGETVAKGALLLELNNEDLKSQQQKNLLQTELAEKKLNRLKKLLDIKGVSQEEYDMQLNEVESLKSDQQFLAAQLRKTRITAPFDGVIGLRNVSVGAFVNASTPIASLVQMKPLYVEFSLPEKYSQIINKGNEISFLSEGTESSEKFTAKVYAIEPRVDETTKSIKIRAMYNGDKHLYPGSFVKVFANLGNSVNALMVPTQCVIPTLKGQKVFVVKSGIAAEVPVKTGVRTDQKIQIIEGIQPGDTLVSTGLLSVKKDSKLILKPSR
ncbi:MAG: efflux RND transporter periplasmic adaptor subunit [Bacteroidia bacterium]|nr:efflux RND transporter periplasmic adaptor subunit [Bacteroidia bacterium]